MEKVKEIKIISEGKQLKNILEEKYPYEELLEMLQLKENTLRKYLGAREISGKKFIAQLEELFQKPYNQIVNTIEDQLRDYIVTMKNTIHEYRTPADNKTVADAYNLALKYSQPYEQLMADANFAMYYANMGLPIWGAGRLEKMLESCVQYDFKELIVHYNIHLAGIYFNQEEYNKEKIRTVLNRVQVILDGESSKNVVPQEDEFSYYSFSGDVLREWVEHQQAREMYHKSLDYTSDDIKIASIYNNIGLTYYHQEEYDTAIDWYNRALDQCKTDHDVIGRALNYLALTYNKKGIFLLRFFSVASLHQLILFPLLFP